MALHGVIGDREIASSRAPAGRHGRSLRRTGRCARGSIVHRSASARTGRRAKHGTRIEPLVSEPSASGTRPPATAAADPLDEPPVICAEIVRIARRAVVRVFAGEVVGVFAHVERAEEDGAMRLRARSISVASRPAGGASRLIFEPASVGSPAISNRFLTANGTPASGGSRFAARPRVVKRLRAPARALLGDAR